MPYVHNSLVKANSTFRTAVVRATICKKRYTLIVYHHLRKLVGGMFNLFFQHMSYAFFCFLYLGLMTNGDVCNEMCDLVNVNKNRFMFMAVMSHPS